MKLEGAGKLAPVDEGKNPHILHKKEPENLYNVSWEKFTLRFLCNREKKSTNCTKIMPENCHCEILQK